MVGGDAELAGDWSESVSDPCTHEKWHVQSASVRHTTYGGVEEDFVTFSVVCDQCYQAGELNRVVQDLADEFSTVWWGMSPGLTIVVSSDRWSAPQNAGADE